LLHKFGGHAMAAGLSIRAEHLAEFQAAFEAIAQELLSPTDLTRIIETDGALTKAEFSMDTARSLERQVWGQGFPQPLFEGAFSILQQRVVGEKHTKLKLSCEAGSFDAMLFFHADPLPAKIHAVYSLEINAYNGTASLQLIIKHWQ
jgi:single-stranded-DNA-specific exonuclease